MSVTLAVKRAVKVVRKKSKKNRKNDRKQDKAKVRRSKTGKVGRIVQTSFNLDDVRETMEQLETAPKKANKVIERSVKDFKKRAPGIVSTEVTKVYNVKKKEITTGEIGDMTPRATSPTAVALTYRGRLLTPTHFGMTPKKPPEGKSYTIKASIFKGKKVVIGRYKKRKKTKKKKPAPYGKGKDSGFILFPTGAKSKDKTSHIPMMRKANGDIVKHTTLSLPQMITKKKVATAIDESIDAMMTKRINHHTKNLKK